VGAGQEGSWTLVRGKNLVTKVTKVTKEMHNVPDIFTHLVCSQIHISTPHLVLLS